MPEGWFDTDRWWEKCHYGMYWKVPPEILRVAAMAHAHQQPHEDGHPDRTPSKSRLSFDPYRRCWILHIEHCGYLLLRGWPHKSGITRPGEADLTAAEWTESEV